MDPLSLFLVSVGAAVLSSLGRGGAGSVRDPSHPAVPGTYGAEGLLFPLKMEGERKITSPYGWRIHPVHKERRFHDGVDLKAPEGTPVIAPADGVVAYTVPEDYQAKACGWGISIDHGPNLRTIFCHLSRKDVKKGDRVKAGQVIGLSGGRKGAPGAGTSTGPHLHFAVQTRTDPKQKRKSTDPVPLLSMNSHSETPPEASTPPETEQTMTEWLWSFLPDFSTSESLEDSSPIPPGTSMFLLAPAVEARLVSESGQIFEEGPVPSGTYTVEVSGKPPFEATLSDGKTYKASSIGRLFEISD